jgi:hypothetical protein
MRTFAVPALVFCALLTSGCAPDDGGEPAATEAAPAAETPAMAPAPDLSTTEGKIASATSAAPPEIASQAQVMAADASGTMVELRPGTNGWLCMPDIPDTPGTDPMCADATWQQWLGAYMSKSTPQVSSVGIAYMLQGGSDASNTDPFATQPAQGQDWVDSGAHVMVLPPNVAMLDAFPTDPLSGGPFVMWKGTPYAHLMVPVAPREGSR